MDDSELLELAAKAAGFKLNVSQSWGAGLLLDCQTFWSPLTDDGDALRLAFALGMSVDAGACIINFCVPDAEDDDLEQEREMEFDNHDGDIAKLRRAIVRAAAEIGRAM